MRSYPVVDSDCQIPLVSILVVSCDKYSDLWRPFFGLFRERWPDCPYRVYLGSNHKIYPDQYVTPVLVGDDISWASGVLRMLDQIDTNHVIMFLEDFLIQSPVDTSAIKRYAKIAINSNSGCLRLSPYPPPTIPLPDYSDLGFIMAEDLYRVSTQVAIWQVGTLRRLLIPGFSAWDFELSGSQLSSKFFDQFYCVWKPAILYLNGVERGKWRQEGVALCREAKIDVDLAHRPMLTEEEIDAYHKSLRVVNLKNESLAYFLNGDRYKGFETAIRYLFRKPFEASIWGIIIFGLMGPHPLKWLREKYFHVKMERHYRKWDNAQ